MCMKKTDVPMIYGCYPQRRRISSVNVYDSVYAPNTVFDSKIEIDQIYILSIFIGKQNISFYVFSMSSLQ